MPSVIRITAINLCLCGVLLLFNIQPLSAQTTPDSGNYQPFSDFHIHTSFKNYYRFVANPDSTILFANDPGYLNKRYGATDWIAYEKKPKDKINAKESNMANYDQSDYANLLGLHGSVLCMASITPPEKVMLSTKSDRWINYHMVTHMSMERQEALAAENNSSFKEFLGEYHYVVNQDSVHEGTKILLAKNNADLKRIIAEGGIGLVMTIEGGHVLFGNEVLNQIKNIKSKDCDTPCRLEILANIDKLRALPTSCFFYNSSTFWLE